METEKRFSWAAVLLLGVARARCMASMVVVRSRHRTKHMPNQAHLWCACASRGVVALWHRCPTQACHGGGILGTHAAVATTLTRPCSHTCPRSCDWC